MNNAVAEIKSTLEGTNSRITEAEERISKVKDRMVGKMKQRGEKKKIKRNKDNFSDLWGNVKHPNI